MSVTILHQSCKLNHMPFCQLHLLTLYHCVTFCNSHRISNFFIIERLMLFHTIDIQYSVNFIYTRKQNNLCDSFYCDIASVRWSGTEPTTSELCLHLKVWNNIFSFTCMVHCQLYNSLFF